MTETKRPCEQCPWRRSNQGKSHPGNFYTIANLRRLWNQIRGGGREQSCHLTDPSHPDHIIAGAKPGATAQECPGSVVLVMREIGKMANADRQITDASLGAYQATRKRGLTKRGIAYWVVSRLQFGGVPYVGGRKLPMVDDEDNDIGLPSQLENG